MLLNECMLIVDEEEECDRCRLGVGRTASQTFQKNRREGNSGVEHCELITHTHSATIHPTPWHHRSTALLPACFVCGVCCLRVACAAVGRVSPSLSTLHPTRLDSSVTAVRRTRQAHSIIHCTPPILPHCTTRHRRDPTLPLLSSALHRASEYESSDTSVRTTCEVDLSDTLPHRGE